MSADDSAEAGEVLVCRCQEVSRGQVRAAIADGACCLRDVKLVTRAMMGLCQGRTCRREIARELAAAGADPAALVDRRERPPVRPVPVAALAAGRAPEGDAS
jgi:NAD(P)H-nitrite reductase large subunit